MKTKSSGRRCWPAACSPPGWSPRPAPPRTRRSPRRFSAGTLSVTGDSLDNNITVSRNAAGNILVNGGAVSVIGGTPTVANTALIKVFGLGGNDVAHAQRDQRRAARRAAVRRRRQRRADRRLRRRPAVRRVRQRHAARQGRVRPPVRRQRQRHADRRRRRRPGRSARAATTGSIWNPGDDTDLNEGGAGTDTIEVNGGNGAEQFTTTANGTRVRFDRLDPAPFAIDIGTSENLVLNANGGDDSFSATGNLAALIKITVDGGTGNDTLLGSNGIDILLGGDGNDFVDGQQGNDVGFLGAGDDVFQWDPGDGSDVIEGQDGTDSMLFNGSAANERMEASANGGRVLFTRDVANIVMDLDDVETIDANAARRRRHPDRQRPVRHRRHQRHPGPGRRRRRRRPRGRQRRSSTARTATTSSRSRAPAPARRSSGFRPASPWPARAPPTTA